MKTVIIASALLSSGVLASPAGIILAVKVDGKLIDLYSESVGDDKYSVLGYGKPGMSQSLHLDGEMVYKGPEKNPSFVGRVGTNWLGYAKADGFGTKLRFDETNKVTNQKFYACSSLLSEGTEFAYTFTRISFNQNAQPGCFPVDIYKINLL